MGTNAIVGIDPGVQTAVAILDLNGDVVDMRSCRNFSLNKILNFVSSQCSPLFIASDVFPAPKLLEKVAAAFSVRVLEPPENFSKRAKSRLVHQFDLSERERHKKDALAAAVSAYESKLPLIRRVKRKIYESGLSGMIDAGDVYRKIISQECNNINSAIHSITKEMGIS